MEMATSRSTWKRLEREVAKELGGVRIPCSGNAGLEGDVLHDHLHIEAKLREKLKIHTWYQKAREDSLKMKIKKPVALALKMKGKHTTYIVMDIQDFKQFLNIKTEGENADTTRKDKPEIEKTTM